MRKKCEGKLSYRGWRCKRPASVEVDGKFYCWQHEPVRVEKLAQKRAKDAKERFARMEREADARIERKVLEEKAGVIDLTDGELREIIAFGGVRGMLRGLRNG